MRNLKAISINPNTKLSEAIKKINNNEIKFILIINKFSILVGVLNDGDIRRAILNKLSLNLPVKNVMSKKPIKVEIGTPRHKIISLMKREKIFHMPIVDKNSKVLDLVSLNDLLTVEKKQNIIVIMAGGEGKRLRPLTKKTPKPMLIIKDKPILQMIFENYLEQGFNNFLFSVNYKAKHIKNYFQAGEEWDAKINYLEEKKQLGTAGSLSLINNIPKKPFIVQNGDLLTNLDYEKLINYHIESKSFATMVTHKQSFEIPYGVVNTRKKDIRSLEEKPSYEILVNAGIYVFSPEAINLVPKNEYIDMPDFFNSLINLGKSVKAYMLNDLWLDVGNLNEFKKAQKIWINKKF